MDKSRVGTRLATIGCAALCLGLVAYVMLPSGGNLDAAAVFYVPGDRPAIVAIANVAPGETVSVLEGWSGRDYLQMLVVESAQLDEALAGKTVMAYRVEGDTPTFQRSSDVHPDETVAVVWRATRALSAQERENMQQGAAGAASGECCLAFFPGGLGPEHDWKELLLVVNWSVLGFGVLAVIAGLVLARRGPPRPATEADVLDIVAATRGYVADLRRHARATLLGIGAVFLLAVFLLGQLLARYEAHANIPITLWAWAAAAVALLVPLRAALHSYRATGRELARLDSLARGPAW